MRFAVIPSEARNPSSMRMPRKERFLTSQTPFGMTNSRFFSRLLEKVAAGCCCSDPRTNDPLGRGYK